jgi:ankyrin repeat protein
MFAARTNKAVVEFLITNKADVNVATKQKDTALHIAVSRGNTELVEVLLKHGADVNARNDQGQNAGHLVVRGGRSSAKQILELLIRQKTDLNVRDKDGFTVLDGARGTAGTELHQIVKRNGGRGGNFPD